MSRRGRSAELHGVGVGFSLSQRQNSTSCPRREQNAGSERMCCSRDQSQLGGRGQEWKDRCGSHKLWAVTRRVQVLILTCRQEAWVTCIPGMNFHPHRGGQCPCFSRARHLTPLSWGSRPLYQVDSCGNDPRELEFALSNVLPFLHFQPCSG